VIFIIAWQNELWVLGALHGAEYSESMNGIKYVTETEEALCHMPCFSSPPNGNKLFHTVGWSNRK